MTDESFDDLMDMLDSPVLVVTTQADGHPSGCVVTFASQTSVQPPSFMVSLPANSHTVQVASRSDYLVAHALPRDKQVLAQLFSGQSDDQTSQFAQCAWRAGPMGMPILDDALGWLLGRIASRSEVGDHVAYLLEPIAVWAPESSEDLLYLSDMDEDFEPGQEAPQRLYTNERAQEARRYGMRFTLDVP